MTDLILVSKEEIRQIIAARLSEYNSLLKFDFLVIEVLEDMAETHSIDESLAKMTKQWSL